MTSLKQKLARTADIGRIVRFTAQFMLQTKWSREKIAEHQIERFHALMSIAKASPLQAERLRKARSTGRLADVEPIDKATMMKRFDEALTRRDLFLAPEIEQFLQRMPEGDAPPFLRDEIAAMVTSGSSALRGVMLFDRDVIAMGPGLLSARFGSERPRRFPPNIATILSTDPRHGSGFASRFLPKSLSDTHAFSARTDLASTVEKLNAIDPDVLSTYPSKAAELAEMKASGRLRVRPVVVWCGGEVLPPKVRARVREVFGCPVREVYGITEAGYVGLDCKEGRLHIADDLYVIEVVDAAGEPVPDGDRGESILITHLYNRILPIIRYRVEDRVRLGVGPCPCGSGHRWIAAIEGRSGGATMFDAPDGRGGQTTVLGWTLRSDLISDNDVMGAQITLHPGGLLSVTILPARGADTTTLEQRARSILRRSLTVAGADPEAVRFDVRVANELERLPSGKVFTLRRAESAEGREGAR